MGRPVKPERELRRHAIGLRTTKTLYDRIHAAAEKAGRTVSQEIEYRLEQSFGPMEVPDTAPRETVLTLQHLATIEQKIDSLGAYLVSKPAVPSEGSLMDDAVRALAAMSAADQVAALTSAQQPSVQSSVKSTDLPAVSRMPIRGGAKP